MSSIGTLPPWVDARIAANGRTVAENFSKWFGASKVRTKLGEPLRVFYGTKSDFAGFDMELSAKELDQGRRRIGAYFSSSPEVAASYCGQRTPGSSTKLPSEELYQEWLALLARRGPGGFTKRFRLQHAVSNPPSYNAGGAVMPVYLRATKLLTVNARGESWNSIHYKNDDWDSNYLVAHAREAGYDGVLVRNVHDRAEGKGPPADVYVVFRAEQIKSAVGNSGLFLPSSRSLTDRAEDLALHRALEAQRVLLDLASKPAARKRVRSSMTGLAVS